MGHLTYIALLVCIVLSYDTTSARRLLQTENGKIVGGTEVPIEDYPYMAFLLLFNGTHNFVCGGSIISRRHILTAAHCLEDIISVTVRIGSARSSSGGLTYESEWFSDHPFYDPITYDYDAALIRVPLMNLAGANATRIPLVRGARPIPSGTNMNVTGWGATIEGGFPSELLMGTTVPTLSNPECQEIFGTDQVTERVFCAGLEEGGRDSCQGDSGGPGVSQGRQIGIVSSGFGCALPNTPGFYTNITNLSIRSWIRLNTGV